MSDAQQRIRAPPSRQPEEVEHAESELARAQCGGPLAEGDVQGDRVTCPWHGSIFNIKTGEALGPPAMEDVATYGVRVTEDDIEIDVP